MSELNFSSRFEFVKSKGVAGGNTRAWSFVNEIEKFVIFGAWEQHRVGSRCLILSDGWKIRNGRKQGGFTHSKKHIDQILEDGFKLFTFSQTAHERKNDEEPARIKSWEAVLLPKELIVENGEYFAVDLGLGQSFPPESSNNHGEFWEGNESSRLTTQYERNPKARSTCLKKYGYICQVCEFDFLSVYGEIGREFIHVHHIVPVSARKKPYKVNPKIDLIPLCPNCHSMIHRQTPPMGVEELRNLINNNVTEKP